MGKVACIYFTEDNIILFKDNLKCSKIKKIYYSINNLKEHIYYNIYICCGYTGLSNRLWYKLERELKQLDITYIIWPKDIPAPLFEQLEVISGQYLKKLLSYHIFRYIGKYKLVKHEPMYMNIGVVAGRFTDTIDVIYPLLDEVTSLTIITEMPSIYQEVVAEIYSRYRLKVKVAHPHRRAMENLDIIYDVNPNNHYMNLCDIKSVYVDLMGYLTHRDLQYEGNTPIIWNGFDILCDSYEMTIPLLEAICYSEGYSRRSLKRKIKDLDISISRVYIPGKLTMSV